MSTLSRIGDEDFTVADYAGPGTANDGFNCRLDDFSVDGDIQSDFPEHVDFGNRAAKCFLISFGFFEM